MPDALTIDGFGPLPVRRPATVTELGELVRETAAAGQGLYPVGGGTALDLGLPPSKPGFAVETRGLDRVVDYPARDMTVTVQAGITVAALQTLLTKGYVLVAIYNKPSYSETGITGVRILW